MALTLVPHRDGSFQLVNEDGNDEGHGMARASKSVPGYVTIVISLDDFHSLPALRVPADWLLALEDGNPAWEAVTRG